MKKILLGTTALVGAALFSQAALADAPKVTVGGDSVFEAGLLTNDDQSGGFTGASSPGFAANSAGQSNRAFYTRNEISVKVDGKSDSGLGYGSAIWLTADTSSDENGRGVNATRTYIYLDGLWGRVEAGSNYGADDTMKVDAGTIARASGGIDGDWRFFVNNRASVPFIATSDLPVNYGMTGSGFTGAPTTNGFGDQSTENVNKVTYYTPKWNGLQAGLSYAPNDKSAGQITTRTDSAAAVTSVGSDPISFSQVDNIWQGGLNWTGQWNQIGIALSATGEHGDAETVSYHDLNAWALGGKLSYLGWSLAGSYGSWGDSLRAPGSDLSSNNFWTGGLAYEYGPYGVSVTYLGSTVKAGTTAAVGSNEFSNVVVGADYKLAPGLTPYAEVAFYEENGHGAGDVVDNNGQLFLLGTQLNF